MSSSPAHKFVTGSQAGACVAPIRRSVTRYPAGSDPPRSPPRRRRNDARQHHRDDVRWPSCGCRRAKRCESAPRPHPQPSHLPVARPGWVCAFIASRADSMRDLGHSSPRGRLSVPARRHLSAAARLWSHGGPGDGAGGGRASTGGGARAARRAGVTRGEHCNERRDSPCAH